MHSAPVSPLPSCPLHSFQPDLENSSQGSFVVFVNTKLRTLSINQSICRSINKSDAPHDIYNTRIKKWSLIFLMESACLPESVPSNLLSPFPRHCPWGLCSNHVTPENTPYLVYLCTVSHSIPPVWIVIPAPFCPSTGRWKSPISLLQPL